MKKMRIIIAGAGSVGRYMAAQLHSQGHDVVLVDNDPGAASKSHSVAIVLADACELDTLTKVGAATADVVAAVTGDDEDNLVISLLAKQEFGVPRVIARVNNPDNEWMFNEMWGVDMSVSTPHLLTALVEEAVTTGSFVKLLSLERGNVVLAEVTLEDESPAVGTMIHALGLPREVSIVAIIRSTRVVSPHPDTVLQAKDEVLVLSESTSEPEIRRILIGR